MSEAARAELARLAAAAAPLEPDAQARAGLMALAFDHAQAFLGELGTGPANRGWEKVFAGRPEPEFAEEGRPAAEILDWLGESVDRPGITTASPRFMGYVPGGGLFHSAIGDFLADASNK